MHLSSHPTSAGAARRFVRDRLRGWGVDGPTADAVLLCADELVTNAIVHVGTDIDLVVTGSGGAIRVEVHDGSGRPPLRELPAGGSAVGRGLQLVDVLATRWGIEPGKRGKCIWFEISADQVVAFDA